MVALSGSNASKPVHKAFVDLILAATLENYNRHGGGAQMGTREALHAAGHRLGCQLLSRLGRSQTPFALKFVH